MVVDIGKEQSGEYCGKSKSHCCVRVCVFGACACVCARPCAHVRHGRESKSELSPHGLEHGE